MSHVPVGTPAFTPPGGLRSWLFFLLLSGLLVASCWPALHGSWVYDDRLLPLHPQLSSVAEVPGLLRRNSDDFLSLTRSAGPAIRGAATYRPGPMVTFALTNGLFGPHPLPHHVVSLTLHLLCLLLLCRLLAQDGRLSPLRAFFLGAFALHPALAEAYQWINGRADELAGLLLCLVATVQDLDDRRRGDRRPGWKGGLLRAGLLFPLLLLGDLAKETFVPAALGLLLAWSLPEHLGTKDSPEGLLGSVKRCLLLFWPGLLAWTLGLLGFLALRSSAMASMQNSALSSLPFLTLLQRSPRILGLAMETLLVPLPRPMRILSWEFSRGFPPAYLVLDLSFLLLCGALAAYRRPRSLMLVLSAAAIMLPTGMVASSFWLGFDRYLYMPACLLLLLLRSVPAESGRPQPQPWLVRLAMLAGGGVLLGLFLGNHATAQHYRSHRDFALSLAEEAPEDPGGYIFLATDTINQGERALTVRVLDRIPSVDLPAAMAHQLALVEIGLGRTGRAAAVVERAYKNHPDDPDLHLDVFALRGAQGRWQEALDLARDLSGHRERRRAAGQILTQWLAKGLVPDKMRPDFLSLLPPVQ